MKNKLIAMTLMATMAISLIACGKDNKDSDEKKKSEKEATTTQTEIEYNVDDYVTLGDYKGIEVTLDGNYEYTDEGFDEYVQSTINSEALFVEDSTQTEIKEDSIVNVDYVGSQDGVAFNGGSAEDQMIDVANNCSAGSMSGYIEGFTAGLVGHSVGEEVAYEVTFPEEYQNEDLAGQTVTFTFQVNYIAKAITSKSDLTDEIVSENFGYDTVKEYLAYLKEQYTKTLEDNLANDKETAVLNSIINNSTVSEIPEELLQARVDLILYTQDLQYQSYGTTMKDYAESMGYDYDEIVSQLTESVKESTETEMILEAIAKAEGLEVDEDGYNEFITPIYTQMGYSDLDSFYTAFSVDGYGGERYFKLAYLTEKATDFCVENAVVNFTDSDAE
ncbi:FKBP-type peptidyl-prolyl cis-trans isomerase [Pseudobutyrivibrio sp. MD2005]|uniref:FKBP-type peptidyl-prolyl cis-trans isomerase n=1 Tax=Pseudobutyrivibrio sp. MD2005 TaxID=1410616 RepID=UPI000486130C|nr:FKBP-type peptidyl-prolyl cis-trans isomerase [Pseudobutyrivibrio sp. MD2005]